MRSALFDQARLIADEKRKLELAILQTIATSAPQALSNAGALPREASAGNASFATKSDAHALLMAVLEQNAMDAVTPVRRTSATILPPMTGSPQGAAMLSASRAASTDFHQHQQLKELVAASLNALLLGNANKNTTSTHSLAPRPPPVVAPRGSTTTMLPLGGTHAIMQPAGLSQPPHQTELLAILQLLQMNRTSR